MGLMTALRQMGNSLRFGERPGVAQSALRRLFRHLRGRQIIDDFDGRFTVSLDLAEHMQRRMFWMGYYNIHLVSFLDRIIEPGMTVIDVGANIGEISLVCANRVGPGGCVIAIEPIAGIADQLQRNVQDNGLQETVQVHRQGLAAQAGQLPIYASCGQTDGVEFNQGLGSLYGNASVDRFVGVADITTLEDVAQRVGLTRLDLLKIDIEGGELPCLQGGLNIVRRFLPVIAVEVQEQACVAAGYQSRDILAFLQPLGYRFHRLEAQGRLVRIEIADLRDYQDVICIAGPLRAVEAA